MFTGWSTGPATSPTTLSDRESLKEALRAVRRLQAWADSRKVVVSGRLAKLSSYPEKDIAKSFGRSIREAEKATKRAETTELFPYLGQALAEGDIDARHVDVVTNASRDLKPEEQLKLQDQAEALADKGTQTAGEFAKTVTAAVRTIHDETASTPWPVSGGRPG